MIKFTNIFSICLIVIIAQPTGKEYSIFIYLVSSHPIGNFLMFDKYFNENNQYYDKDYI